MMENGEGNIAFPVSYTKMKYAHYLAFFASHKDPKAFKAFIEDVRRIVDNAPENADLCGTLPQEPPLIGEEGVTIGCSSNTSRFSRFKVLASSKAIAHRDIQPQNFVMASEHKGSFEVLSPIPLRSWI